MAKSRRASSRKMKHTRKHKTHRRRTHRKRTHRRRRGGMAPVNYHLSGSWPSRMSLGQGADYFKYHQGQHGGVAPLSAIGKTLPPELAGAAHLTGINKAYADIAGLKDGGDTDPIVVPGGSTTGGRRRKHKKSRKHSRKVHRRSYRNKRRNGGALGYAPFPSSGMLLKTSAQYAQAGLNPEWKTDVAFTDAKIRDTQ